MVERKRTLLAGAAAAIGASVCCVGPLVPLTLGIGGAWVGNLTALEPVRPLLAGVTLLFLKLAFRRLYLVPQVCAPEAACAQPAIQARQRAVFWLAAAAMLLLLAKPWLATFFY